METGAALVLNARKIVWSGPSLSLRIRYDYGRTTVNDNIRSISHLVRNFTFTVTFPVLMSTQELATLLHKIGDRIYEAEYLEYH